MRLIYKILIGVGILLVLAVVALSLLVRAYLKPERIRPLVVERVEKALGRKVELARVEVGLFKGIRLEGLSVKEADGKTDFVRVKGLRVKFALWPLLQKKVVLTRAEISGPYLHLVRDRKGHFNWESLGPPKPSAKKPSAEKPSAQGGAPFLLVVPKFEIKEGLLVFEDQLGELPSLKIPFQLAASLTEAEARARLSFRVFDSPWQAEARVAHWTSAPDLFLSLSGETLDLNPFLKEGPQAGEKPSPSSGVKRRGAEKEVKLPALPFRRAQARVNIKKILYRKLAVSALALKASYAKGHLTSELTCEVARGKVKDRIEAELLSHPPHWKVRETGEGVEIAELLSGLWPDLPGRLRGRASYDGNFTASGLSLAKMMDTLSGSGVFRLAPLELSDLPATRKLASLLGLPELSTLLFDRASGIFQIAQRRATLSAALSGKTLSARIAQGVVTLDGILDLPVDLVFSPELSKKLTGKWPPARHLVNEKGEVELTLELKGPYRKPRVILRSRAVERTIKEKVQEQLQKWLPFGK
ncbi:AsmA family protein [Thermosulfurimonas marina]|uniref:AsmA family protein n=1 Tax=Thermosulfurimonas marina TaxID=2047767 RepID=A0A6H1WTX4_9BACT|nr:AsmA family protein [Thermosulfurimonas marina]QJA06566.1 AsmA family protein [Thermosulfurimonas marina]